MNSNDFPDALPPEYRLHWYVLERVLGQGGFGITYVARDTNLDKTVAIKEYLPVDVATRRPDSSVRSRTEDQNARYRGGLERFIREARTLARFDHPNIVRVHSVFEFNGTAYMVMRFEEGETMAAVLERQHALPEPELKRTLLPILDGLELVHGAGFIHRDIKPDNILIRVDGSPVLLDFGSARYAARQSRTVTILVAPGYAPIEQYYNSAESQGPWTDIYGLGATCYRAITGHPPMDAIARSKGKLGSTQEMLLPALVAGHGRYSERFLVAVDRALEFSEKDRPQSIAEWRELLLEGPAPAASCVEPAASQRAATPLRRTNRAPLFWAAAGAIAASVAIIGIALWDQLELPFASKPSPAAPAPVLAKGNDDVEQLRRQLAEMKEIQGETQARLSAMLERGGGTQAPQPESEAPQGRIAEAAKRKEAEPIRLKEPEPSRRVVAKPVASGILHSASAATAKGSPEKVESPQSSEAPPPAPVTATAEPPAVIAAREPTPSISRDPVTQLKVLVERNDADAMLRLGDLYQSGEGVERSELEAARLYRRAADAGNSEAQLRLGDLYSNGRGVPKNNFQAYVWYTAAARSGNRDAKGAQERTAQLLQAAEITQAGKLVEAMSRKSR